MIHECSYRRRLARIAWAVAVIGCAASAPGGVSPPSTATATTPRPQLQRSTVTLERRPCYGTCPVYVVSIAGDGSVVFDGRAHVDSARRVISQVDTARVAALMRFVEETRFFALDDAYVAGGQNCRVHATDAPVVVSSISTPDRIKRVEHDHGCRGVPAQLTLLENRIDEVAGVWRWTTGRPPH